MIFNYCPECAKPLQKVTGTHYQCFDGHDLWNNAKGSVALAFIRGNEMLFSKRGDKSAPNFGMYDLPGGFVEFGESAQAAAIRECREETSVEISEQDLELVAVYHNLYSADTSSIDVIFMVHNWSGEFKAGDDSAVLEWKPFDFIHNEKFCEKFYIDLDRLISAKSIA